MQLVIELDEWVFNRISWDNSIDHDTNWRVTKAILNSTILPEHHGRLIDADALQTEMEKDVRKAMSFVDLKDFVWLAPTIIEGSESE